MTEGFKRRDLFSALASGAAVSLLGGLAAVAEPSSTTSVFELRVYHANEGKMEALLSRFREHTTRLFEKHGITNVGYWVPLDEPLKGRTLFYMLKYPSREEASLRWKTFQDDPEWVRVRAASEINGKLVDHVDSTFLELTDFSPKV